MVKCVSKLTSLKKEKKQPSITTRYKLQHVVQQAVFQFNLLINAHVGGIQILGVKSLKIKEEQ